VKLTDNNSLYETFRKTKYVLLNTLDWYREFDIATHLELGKKMNDTNKKPSNFNDFKAF